MKAITIYQPWASLLACGAKKYETRSWETDYRGEIAIHVAAKNIDKIIYSQSGEFWDTAGDALHNPELVNLPYGCVIATAELVACNVIYDNLLELRHYVLDNIGASTKITGNELLFGDFLSGRYAWEFKNMKLLDKPIPAKGKQRLWEWNEDMKG